MEKRLRGQSFVCRAGPPGPGLSDVSAACSRLVIQAHLAFYLKKQRGRVSDEFIWVRGDTAYPAELASAASVSGWVLAACTPPPRT